MCGIVGARTDWLRTRGRDPDAAMQQALAAMQLRGPDGAGVAVAGPWRLGCARLAITRARSRQPVVLRGGRFTGVLNGNVADAAARWAALRPRAARRGEPPNDAWLPLLAVAARDVDALAGLRGHHAYAVADAASGELVFGQDRFGEKPLWCVVEGAAGAAPRLVAFASTPAALRALGLPLRWRRPRLAEWFQRGWQHDAPLRLAANLRLVAVPQRGVPLSTASAAFGWCGPLRQPAGAHAGAPADAAAPPRTGLRAALLASVARSSTATVPAALALSGGVDSSCLALALRELGRPLPAYQAQAVGGDGSERAAAAAVAAACGLPLRTVDVGPDALLALPRLTAAAGMPLGDPSILAVHALCTAVAADGGKVLLGGEGADELFLGYRRYRALRWLPRLPWLSPFVPRLGTGYAARCLRAAAAADPAAALLAVTPPGFADLVLAADVARRRGWRGRRRGEPAAAGDRMLAARADDLAGYLRLDLLPKVDVAGLAAGVETRCPFLDRDVADSALADGAAGLGKAKLRAAFPDLPAAVLRLQKRGFALPLDRWFRGELPWLDLLAEARTRQRPHLRPGGVAAAVDRHRSGRADLGHGLYLLVAAELHLRWLDGERHAATESPRLQA